MLALVPNLGAFGRPAFRCATGALEAHRQEHGAERNLLAPNGALGPNGLLALGSVAMGHLVSAAAHLQTPRRCRLILGESIEGKNGEGQPEEN